LDVFSRPPARLQKPLLVPVPAVASAVLLRRGLTIPLRTPSSNGPRSRARRALDEERQALLRLLGCGLTVPEAAERLHLSLRTAERRLAEAREALDAATNAEAVLRATGRTIPGRGDGLSEREREVVELIGAGLHDVEIAVRMGVAPSTVATLLRSAMAKLDARTRVEAVAKLAGIEDDQ
jgi:DNA-binding NarL/FixJ family response regulator